MDAILAKLLGGRPMRLVRYAFTDVISGEQVNFYLDRLGRPWLATSPWSLFRVKPSHPSRIWRNP
jgi:hypothetical protein